MTESPSETPPTIDLAVEADGQTTTVTVEGDIDAHTCEHLQAVLDERLDDGARNLVLDLASVGFIDSSGLRVLVHARRRVDPVGGSIVLRRRSEAVQRLLEITGLAESFIAE